MGHAPGTNEEHAEVYRETRSAIVTTKQVSELTGATLRMLQYWDERGYIRGVQKIRGNRDWDPDHVRRAWLYRAMGDIGASHAIRRVSRNKADVLQFRYLLFAMRTSHIPKLICLSDDRDAILKAATDAECGVKLIEMPDETLLA
jgi:MerR HTH family regulatory protein